jgi:hypothetical protein
MTRATWTATLCALALALLLAVRGALAESCCAGDVNNDQVVTIDEILKAVSAALNGCAAAPAPCLATAQPLRTGQTQCDQGDGTLGACPGFTSGQDGQLQNGADRRYTDNGDGTITDNSTGLMWEKLSGDGSDHDKGNTYNWNAAFLVKIFNLNSSRFAGYSDWRLPNVNELQSLADYGRLNPAVDPIFNTNCTAMCKVTKCSCTQAYDYWSATTYAGHPANAWLVSFGGGDVFSDPKTFLKFVRAVRGGL